MHGVASKGAKASVGSLAVKFCVQFFQGIIGWSALFTIYERTAEQ